MLRPSHHFTVKFTLRSLHCYEQLLPRAIFILHSCTMRSREQGQRGRTVTHNRHWTVALPLSLGNAGTEVCEVPVHDVLHCHHAIANTDRLLSPSVVTIHSPVTCPCQVVISTASESGYLGPCSGCGCGCGRDRDRESESGSVNGSGCKGLRGNRE